jgi:hypothetical protein
MPCTIAGVGAWVEAEQSGRIRVLCIALGYASVAATATEPRASVSQSVSQSVRRLQRYLL